MINSKGLGYCSDVELAQVEQLLERTLLTHGVNNTGMSVVLRKWIITLLSAGYKPCKWNINQLTIKLVTNFHGHPSRTAVMFQ